MISANKAPTGPLLLDCTLRDGGYYTQWDFNPALVRDYLDAMSAACIDYVELGLRGSRNAAFAGAHAYTTDDYLRSLSLPPKLKVGVMVNAGDILDDGKGGAGRIGQLFAPVSQSPVSLVRLACHAHEVAEVMPAARELKGLGYIVGVNLMQIAGRSDDEVVALAACVDSEVVDVLYFADSLGSLGPERVVELIGLLRRGWSGDLGIHTHDNMGRALQNTVAAADAGVRWLDSTVTGMGRGPGNAATEYVVLEFADRRSNPGNPLKLLETIRRHFGPLKAKHQWGSNPYYYLAGKYAIHPTYVQTMLGDPRFQETEILSVIRHLQDTGASKFAAEVLQTGRHRYTAKVEGTWTPESLVAGREILLLGAGPSLASHKAAVESYIRAARPLVMALNVEQVIDESLVDVRSACHPLRLLADWERYGDLDCPLILPLAQQDERFREAVVSVRCLDFGLTVAPGCYQFGASSAVVPHMLVAAYALSIAASGRAERVLLAGFDGFTAGDPRQQEMQDTLSLFQTSAPAVPVFSITPTRYDLDIRSVYGLLS
ncbi:MAG: aldolase catalytic domain-containing protein [Lysobacterales bacterium]